jgi:hypothetical protein
MSIQLATPVPAPFRNGANPFVERIAKAYPGLRPAERKVADVLLENPLEFARTSTAIIGDKAGASAPSIIRFCRTMGYSGLTQLKQALVLSLGQHDAALLFHLPPPRPHDTANEVLDAADAMLARLRELAHTAAVPDAIAILARAPHINCIAAYQLGLAAQHARDSLLRLGIAATLPGATGAAGAPRTPPDSQQAASVGLFFCMGMPDAPMLDSIALCQRDGGGAVVLSDLPLPAFVPATVNVVLGAVPASGILLAHCLMTDILLAGLARRRRAALA